jgi:hypothetical protein
VKVLTLTVGLEHLILACDLGDDAQLYTRGVRWSGCT